MKKVFCLLLAAAMLMTVFVGCGPTQRPGNDTEETIPDDGRTHLTFYAREFEEWANAHVKELVERFNQEQSDIYVTVKFFTGDTYSDALTVARENGKAPDVYMLEYGSLTTHAKNGYAAALNDLLPQEALDDLLDNVRQMVTYKDKIYAYPWVLEPATLLFYRKDILQSNGIEKVPQTWQELYDACAKLKTTRKLGEYCLGLPVSSVEYAWTTYGMQQNTCGALAVDDSWMVSNIENQGYKDLCEFFYTIYSNGYAPSAAITSEGYTYIVDALCKGTLAMTFGGSWSIAEIHQYFPEMADKIGVVPIPTRDGNSSITTSGNGGWTYCISGDSMKQTAAATFLKWLFVDDVERTGEYFLKAYNSKAPTSKALKTYLETAPSDVDPQWVEVMYDVAEKGIPEAQYPWDIAYAVGMMFETMQISHSAGSFEEVYSHALRTAKSTIDAVMSRVSYAGNPKYEP